VEEHDTWAADACDKMHTQACQFSRHWRDSGTSAG